MLCWMSGVTRLPRICNEEIRNRFGVAAITDKFLVCDGTATFCVTRKSAVGLDLEVLGKRPKGRRKQRWLNTIHADLKLAGIRPDQAHHKVEWRQRSGSRYRTGQTLKKMKILFS
ncbi:hypothetical protein ANCDUO_02902 [Ancylostoma duodenale]|uniref:Uncharacterized protein n=1 Tax=Ancylostoma duodenale TaxID=51022 RepID=A0A0C2DAK9_9BILA|nr:hypothetical protein ANCDUO_02902 [Ancylostoma duodenale]